MKTYLTVPISDAINKKHIKVALEALHEAILEVWDSGLPLTVAHIRHRLRGWVTFLGLHLEPGLARVIAQTSEPQTPEEEQQILDKAKEYYAKRLQDSTAVHDAELRELLRPLLDGSESVIELSGTAVIAEDLARKKFPELFALEDKDGLIPLNELTQLFPGVYKINELIVYAHSYFRRALSRENQLNAELLDRLHQLSANPACSVRVKLDPDAIGLAASVKEAMEFAYWWGPKFSDDIDNLPVGLTVHGSDTQVLKMEQILKTEFWWQARYNHQFDREDRILEIEEVRNEESKRNQSPEFGCRYIHSIIDSNKKNIIHLDGAIRGYSEEEMLVRHSQSLSQAGRHTLYTKLWRVDGIMPYGQWKSLIHHYFRENSLVGEYLGTDNVGNAGINKDSIEDQSDLNQPSDLDPRTLVYVMQPGDSVRLSLTYHHVVAPLPVEGCAILPRDCLFNDAICWPIVNVVVLELRKIYSALGLPITIAENIEYVIHQSKYIDLPRLVHTSVSALEASINAMSTFLDSSNFCQDNICSLSFGLYENDREIRLSLLGSAGELVAWLRRSQPFPIGDNRTKWLKEAAEYLAQYPAAHDIPPLFETILLTGEFSTNRSIASPDHYVENRGELSLVQNKLPKSLVQAVSLGDLSIFSAYVLHQLKCKACKQDYRFCLCKKCTDELPYTANAEFGFAFWSDK